MTAGHQQGLEINTALAKLSDRKQILMGVGSQRRELTDETATSEWSQIRKRAPNALLIANIGVAQLIVTPIDKIQKLVDSLRAVALFVHVNALQEALQPEGTPDFKGAILAIKNLCQKISVPVIVKEVGTGFSKQTLMRLQDSGVFAVDISGRGGTHWGRIEGYRSETDSKLYNVAQVFKNWGITTAESMLNAIEANVSYQVWASGGVRSGLDAAKLLAMGADKVGMALPFLQAATGNMKNQDADASLDELFEQIQYELQVAMFCTGIGQVKDFKNQKVWKWQGRI